MHTADQHESLGGAGPASWPVSWPEEPGPRYPQASYYRARYYDQGTGRFVSEDPTGFKAGVNFYSYVTNDPVDQTDPSGLDSDSEFCRRIREKINNVSERIQRRIGQLDENPLGLPESCAGDKIKDNPVETLDSAFSL